MLCRGTEWGKQTRFWRVENFHSTYCRSLPTAHHPKLMPLCFYSGCAGAALNFSCPSNFFMIIPCYRSLQPIKSSISSPHMLRPQPLKCSPRFSAWLINKCSHNFAQLVSHSSHWLNREEKHIPFWCGSETSQTPHQVVLIPVGALAEMVTSIIRPLGCWLTCSQVFLSSPDTPFIISWRFLSFALLSDYPLHFPLRRSFPSCFVSS